MTKITTEIVLLIAICLLSPIHGASVSGPQDPEDQARESAKAAVQTHTERQYTFFSAHRREDLEDSFCSVARCVLRDGPKIFQVSDEGYEFKSGGVEYHWNVHGPSTHFVAVAPGSGGIFRIGGFKDSPSELNRLAESCHVNISTELQAQEYAGLYLQLDPAHYQIIKAPSLLLLKQLAERKFDEAYTNFTTAELEFDHWWTRNRSALSRLSFSDKIRATSIGFEVSFLTVSDIAKGHLSDGPAPLVVTVAISKGGQVAGPKLAPMDIQSTTERVPENRPLAGLRPGQK